MDHHQKVDEGVPAETAVGLSAVSPQALPSEDAASIPNAPLHGQLSRDYERLYAIVCAGGRALCFVNMDFRDGDRVYRDAASVRQFDGSTIDIGARGIGYGHISKYDVQRHGSEQAAFIAQCKSLNLEWADVFRVSDPSGLVPPKEDRATASPEERGGEERAETPQQ